MSMYGVNASIPKTLIKYLVCFVADSGIDEQSKATLMDILDTPISPELIPADADGNIKQKTEDLVGPYELHDFFLYNFLRLGFSPRKIFMLARSAFGPEAEQGVGRYDEATINKLQALRWWDWPDEKIKEHVKDIMEGKIEALE